MTFSYVHKKLTAFLSMSSLMLTSMIAQLDAAQKTYKEPDFSNATPVRLEIVQGQGKLGARFVRPSVQGVEIEMLDGKGSIMVGWDHMEQFTINIPMTEALNDAVSEPDPQKRVELLQEEIWPLLPLASIRSESTNIHILLNSYIEAVIASEDWLRGYDMSQYMALNRSPEETVRYLYTIAENLFTVGEKRKALKLIDQLISARPVSESREFSLGIAKRLLDLRIFEPALRLYQSIAEDAEGLNGKKALLNCAYLSLELGELEGAERYFVKAQGISDEDIESLGSEHLYHGVKAFMNGDTNLSLNHLGHAMAVIPVNSHIKQAGLYFTYLSYSNQENTEIAQNIYDEMDLLFPDGAYVAALNVESQPQPSE